MLLDSMKQITAMVKEAEKIFPNYIFSIYHTSRRTNNQTRGMVFVNSANYRNGYKITVKKFTGETRINHGITFHETETIFEANTTKQTGVRERFAEFVNSHRENCFNA